MCLNLSWKHGAMIPWENINIKNVQTCGFQGHTRDANNDPRGEAEANRSWVSPLCSLVPSVPSVQTCILFGPHQTLMGLQRKTGEENAVGRSKVELLVLLHVVRQDGDKSEGCPTGCKGAGFSQIPSKLLQVSMWLCIDCHTSH